MDNTMKAPMSSLEQDLQKWDMKQHTYRNHYGPGVFNDRDFMKAKKAVLQDIYWRHKNAKLSFEDRIELQILKGQIKQMHERIYPSRWQRAGIALVKFLSRPIEHSLKLVGNILSTFLIGKPMFEHNKNRTRIQKRQAAKATQSLSIANQQGIGTTLTNRKTEKPAVLRRLNRERILTETPAQSLHV